MRLLPGIVILLIAQFGLAQSITTDTLVWQVTSVFEVQTGQTSNVYEKIVTCGSQRIEWQKPSGEVNKAFNVSETVGSWNDASLPGILTFRINNENENGNLRIERTSEGITIQLVYLLNDEPVIYKYNVGSVVPK